MEKGIFKLNQYSTMAIFGLFLAALSYTKIVNANEAYFYPNLTGESLKSFKKNVRIKSVTTSKNGHFIFQYHCGGSWDDSTFKPSASGKPHVLGHVPSKQHLSDVINVLNASC